MSTHDITVNKTYQVTKLALTGKARAGKDEVAKYLALNYGFSRFAFGDHLKLFAHKVFPWIPEQNKPRKLYQAFGQAMRELGVEDAENVWIRHTLETIACDVDITVEVLSKDPRILITDLRQPNEFQRLKDEGYTIIRVKATDESRLQRAWKVGDVFDESDLTHDTESHIDDFDVDYEIDNSGDFEFMESQVDVVMADMGVDKR